MVLSVWITTAMGRKCSLSQDTCWLAQSTELAISSSDLVRAASYESTGGWQIILHRTWWGKNTLLQGEDSSHCSFVFMAVKWIVWLYSRCFCDQFDTRSEFQYVTWWQLIKRCRLMTLSGKCITLLHFSQKKIIAPYSGTLLMLLTYLFFIVSAILLYADPD